MDVLSSLLGGQSLLDVFSNTINGWIGNLVTSAFAAFDQLMLGLLNTVFHVENLVLSGSTTVLTDDSIRNTYIFIYACACSLAIFKFLNKGAQIYILWRDGDADVSPREMAVGCVEAGVVAISFPYLYEKAVNIFIYIAGGIMNNLGVSDGISGSGFLPGLINSALQTGVITIVFLLIFAIMVFVLWIRLLARGFELLILRLGVPFAALGLIDSDMGGFKGYMQIFIKTAMTSIIQVALMSLAFRLLGTFQIVNVLAAIAVITTAFATPIIMQQILVASRGGGGISQKVYSASMVLRSLRSLK